MLYMLINLLTEKKDLEWYEFLTYNFKTYNSRAEHNIQHNLHTLREHIVDFLLIINSIDKCFLMFTATLLFVTIIMLYLCFCLLFRLNKKKIKKKIKKIQNWNKEVIY